MFTRTAVLSVLFGVMFVSFALAQAEEQASEHEDHGVRAEHSDSDVDLHRFIEPAGITTLSFLLATLALGFNVHRKRKVLLPLHKTLAITTACLALLHLALILLSRG